MGMANDRDTKGHRCQELREHGAPTDGNCFYIFEAECVTGGGGGGKRRRRLDKFIILLCAWCFGGAWIRMIWHQRSLYQQNKLNFRLDKWNRACFQWYRLYHVSKVFVCLLACRQEIILSSSTLNIYYSRCASCRGRKKNSIWLHWIVSFTHSFTHSLNCRSSDVQLIVSELKLNDLQMKMLNW